MRTSPLPRYSRPPTSGGSTGPARQSRIAARRQGMRRWQMLPSPKNMLSIGARYVASSAVGHAITPETYLSLPGFLTCCFSCGFQTVVNSRWRHVKDAPAQPAASAPPAANWKNEDTDFSGLRRIDVRLRTLSVPGPWAMDRPASWERSNPARTWRRLDALPGYLNIQACRHRSYCRSRDASTRS